MHGSMISGRRVVAEQIWKLLRIVPVLNPISGLTCDSVASAKGISLVSLVADTNRNMVPDPAVGIDATKTGTRVLALSGDAGQLLGAVRVDHTLRATVRGRANHLGHTGAPTLTANIPWRECVWSTWVGIARVLLNNRLNCCEGDYKNSEYLSSCLRIGRNLQAEKGSPS